MVNTTFVVRPVRQTSHVRMREKITAKHTSSLKLTRNLVLYKNLTDLCRVFLPNRRQRLIIREQPVTQAEVLMCELIAKYIIYISISLYGNFHHEILDY